MLDYNEGFVVGFGRERGRDPGLYYLRIFGEPAAQGIWGWRFGGHHVSLNNLVVDGALVSTTPCFLGANPAVSPLLGDIANRPLARVEDLGRELVRSLHPDLAARAILLPNAPLDVVTVNRTVVTDGSRLLPLVDLWRDERFPDPVEQAQLQKISEAIEAATGLSDADQEAIAYSTRPKGVPAVELDHDQRTLLRALLSTNLGSRAGGHFPTVRLRRPGDPRCGALRLGRTD